MAFLDVITPGVASRGALPQIIRLADSSVNISVRPWVPVLDFGAASSEVNQAILETFRARGIVIPYPRRDVQLLVVQDADPPQPLA